MSAAGSPIIRATSRGRWLAMTVRQRSLLAVLDDEIEEGVDGWRPRASATSPKDLPTTLASGQPTM